MTPPTNTFTITLADAHSHSVVLTGMPGNATCCDGGKADALRAVLDNIYANSDFGAILATDTLTVTVTQP